MGPITPPQETTTQSSPTDISTIEISEFSLGEGHWFSPNNPVSTNTQQGAEELSLITDPASSQSSLSESEGEQDHFTFDSGDSDQDVYHEFLSGGEEAVTFDLRQSDRRVRESRLLSSLIFADDDEAEVIEYDMVPLFTLADFDSDFTDEDFRDDRT